MAWPPSAVLEGGARREALGGMESELVPTEPSQTYPIASVCRLSIIEKRPTNLLVGLLAAFIQLILQNTSKIYKVYWRNKKDNEYICEIKLRSVEDGTRCK